jgi:hypothetical protein
LKRKDAKKLQIKGKRNSEKKGLFRMFSQNNEKLIFKRKWCTKRSEKKRKKGPKEVKKRGNLIEKQKAHGKIGQL